MASKGTWNWNYLRITSSPDTSVTPSSNTNTLNSSQISNGNGGSGNSNNPPRRSSDLKSKSTRLKPPMSQMRRVVKPSPQLSLSNRAAVMLTLSKEMFLALRYLPSGVLSKLPSIPGISVSSSSDSHKSPNHASVSASQTSGVSFSSSGSSQHGPVRPTDMGTPKTDLPVAVAQQPPFKDGSRQNLSSSVATTAALSFSSITKLFEGTLFKKQQKILTSVTRDVDLNRQHLEARTRYLVSSINKNIGGENSVNLLHLIDTFFLHTYQNIETRDIAIDSGAVKVLAKIAKMYASDVSIVNRTRELLALLGHNPPIKGNGIKILAIDGGGVRGLLAIEILRGIEAATGKKIYELFDFICGVSTGSILAFLIGGYRRSLDECESLYKELSREIFNQSSIMGAGSLVWSHAYYSTPGWEKILKKHLGSDTKLISLARDPSLPRVAAISTVVSNERVTPYVFRTYAFPPDVYPKYSGGCRYEMWEAVRASAAAPTYFEEVKLGNHLHQDGGVLVNNPSSIALTEARTIWRDTPLQCVVSVGTGITLTSLTHETVGDQFCSANVQDSPDGKAAKQPSSLSWKGKLLKVLDSATDTEAIHYTLRELLPPEVYFRFNPYVTEVIGLDESQPVKLQKAQAEAKVYVEKNTLKVNSLKKALLKGKGVTKTIVDWWKY